MAARNLEKLSSIDAQLRLLAPSKVSEDDKLVEYDALLLDRFLDILQDLHGEDIGETVTFSMDVLSCNNIDFLKVLRNFYFVYCFVCYILLLQT